MPAALSAILVVTVPPAGTVNDAWATVIITIVCLPPGLLRLLAVTPRIVAPRLRSRTVPITPPEHS